MISYPKAAMERAMKVQEVILRALAKRITWWQAAEIMGISDRQMRRWRERYEELGCRGLFDRRRGKPSPKRVPVATRERVLALYRERYFDLNLRHFHQKRSGEHPIELSYRWVKGVLQGAGLMARGRKRGPHRKRRPRRPLPGMLRHIEGSEHRCFQDDRGYDLRVILDDARSEIYYAQLVEEESSPTVLAGLQEVIGRKGIFCAWYSDRGRHFWLTPKAGEAVDHNRLTQGGRAWRELGIPRIPAYSPQARGRSERNFGTWQGRLPQELRRAGCTTLEAANRFLREHYMAEFNRRFQVKPEQAGTAFVPCRRVDRDHIFCLQWQRTVNRDNTVSFENLPLQIEPVRWRATLAGCPVTVHQPLDGTLSLHYGPHGVGRFDRHGLPYPDPNPIASTELSRGRGTAPFPCKPIPKNNHTASARPQP